MAGNTKGTCPLGGLWYTCTAQTPTFLGCCTSNPCQGDGKICPANDLRAAGMGTDPGPDPGLTSNDGSYWPNVQCPAGSEWWTCALQTPSFQGCCDVNPCGGDGTGCPSSLLHPAAFKSAPLDGGVVSTITLAASTAASKMPSAPTMSLASSSAGLVTSITPPSTSLPGKASETTSRTSALASSTPEPVAGSTPENTSSNLPIGAIAGGAGGGIAILLIALLAFCWCRKRRQKKSPTHIDLQPVMIEYPGYLTSPMAKTNEGHLKSQNSVAYYSGQPVLGDPNTLKYTSVRTSSPPMSPGPPPYQSGQTSPNPNLHEIDSSHVHNVVRPLDPFESHNQNERRVSHSRNNSTEVRDGIAELPHSLTAENRWRTKRPAYRQSVEIGEGSPVTGRGLSSNDGGRMGRESYVSWQSLSP